jgi:glycine hydroxymethyltransferase
MGAYMALVKPGDTLLALDLNSGGHLTHGSPVNFSGLLYKAVSYGLNDDGYIDMDAVRSQALAHRPKMIIAGYSAYPRVIDFAAFAAVRCSWSTWRTSPDWPPRASIRHPSRTPTS